MSCTKVFTALSVLVLAVGTSWGVTINLSGVSDPGGYSLTGTADITETDGGFDYLHIEVANTSPTEADPIAHALLTGFGFNYGDAEEGDLISWEAWVDGTEVTSLYDIEFNQSFPGGAITFNIVTDSLSNVGRIGNPQAYQDYLDGEDVKFGVPVGNIIFDSVEFIFKFVDQSLGIADLGAYYGSTDPLNLALRFQSAGYCSEESGIATPGTPSTPPPPPVPEPGTIALIGLGALGLAAARRRRKE